LEPSKDKLTVLLGKDHNVATMHTAPGFRKYEPFCTTAGLKSLDNYTNPIVAEESLIDTDDKDTNDAFNNQLSKEPQKEEWCQPIDTNFQFDLNATKWPAIINDEEETKQPTNNTAEILKYHHAFGHVSFQKLKEMAKMGTIPKKLRIVQSQYAQLANTLKPSNANGKAGLQTTKMKLGNHQNLKRRLQLINLYHRHQD
jgi:hypothetical protein